jgi:hypothetical protein
MLRRVTRSVLRGWMLDGLIADRGVRIRLRASILRTRLRLARGYGATSCGLLMWEGPKGRDRSEAPTPTFKHQKNTKIQSPMIAIYLDPRQLSNASTLQRFNASTFQLSRAKSSIRFQSFGVSWSLAAATCSSRCGRDDVPGIGSMTGDFCRSQAGASCATVTL